MVLRCGRHISFGEEDWKGGVEWIVAFFGLCESFDFVSLHCTFSIFGLVVVMVEYLVRTK